MAEYDRRNPAGFRVLILFSLIRTKEANRERWENNRLMQFQPLIDIFNHTGHRIGGPRFQLTAALLHAYTYSLATGIPNFVDGKQLRESLRAIDSLK